MKTFEDLQFKDHPAKPSFDKQAVIFFNNGYGASVITGKHAYSDSDNPYEIAVLWGNKDDFSITYNTDITDDVVGRLNEDGVTRLLEKIQNLEKSKQCKKF